MLDGRSKLFHLVDDIPTILECEVLDEYQVGDVVDVDVDVEEGDGGGEGEEGEDDVGAKSWRFRLKWLIEKRRRREERWMRGCWY